MRRGPWEMLLLKSVVGDQWVCSLFDVSVDIQRKERNSRTKFSLGWPTHIMYINNRKLPVLNQGQCDRAITISGKRVYSGSSYNNACCAMWWPRYSHGHTVLQSRIPRERIISYYHRLCFRFFIILIMDQVSLVAFRVFAGSWCGVIWVVSGFQWATKEQ